MNEGSEPSLSGKEQNSERLIYSLLLVIIGIPSFTWVSANNGLFMPVPGPAMLFNNLPSPIFFFGLQIFIFLSLLAFCLEVPHASIALALGFLTGNIFKYSFGKIDHDVLIWTLPLLIEYGKRYIPLFIGFLLFTAALPKVAVGWLDFETQAAYLHALANREELGRDALLADSLFFHPVIWEMLDWFTVLAETVPLLAALFFEKKFFWFLLPIVLFHIGVTLTMNIPYDVNFIGYLLVLPFLKGIKVNRRKLVAIVILIVFFNYLIDRGGFSPSAVAHIIGRLNLGLAIQALWMLFFFLSLQDGWKGRRHENEASLPIGF